MTGRSSRCAKIGLKQCGRFAGHETRGWRPCHCISAPTEKVVAKSYLTKTASLATDELVKQRTRMTHNGDARWSLRGGRVWCW